MKTLKTTALVILILTSSMGMTDQATTDDQQCPNSMLVCLVKGAIARTPYNIATLQSARKSGDVLLSALDADAVDNQLTSIGQLLADSSATLSLSDEFNTLGYELKEEGEAVRTSCGDLTRNNCDDHLAEAQVTLRKISNLLKIK